MLFCKDFCGILVENCGKNVEKWKLTGIFLDTYGTKCIEVNEENLKKYSEIGKLDVIKWLWSKGITVNDAVNLASKNGHLNVV